MQTRYHQPSLLACIQLHVLLDPQVLLCKASLQLGELQRGLMLGFVPPQVHDFASWTLRGFSVPISPAS